MSIKIIHHIFIVSIFLLFFKGNAQEGFLLPEGVEKDKISFQLINNLVVIPVEVNGVTLAFLLDTGVSSTIMFSLSKVDSLELNDAEPMLLRGLGKGGNIPALKSEKNQLKIGKAIDKNHTIFVVFDESLNLSTRMGIPIHGIIGYDFFKNLVVKTNHNTRKITIYNPKTFEQKVCKKCEVFDLTFQNNKPYISFNIIQESIEDEAEVTLLIDSGSSDAIWLFNDAVFNEYPDKKYFEDFLGQGLSGAIFGKRTKLKKIRLGKYELSKVKVAYPNKESIKNINFFEGRDGSIGGELLTRFSVLMDYPSKKIFLKKNNNFRNKFHYNMSGLTIKHDGFVVVKNKRDNIKDNYFENKDATSISITTVYDFTLAPKFIVSEIRKNSPADFADIREGDELVSVNRKMAHNFKLNELIGVFSSKVGKKINLRIKRNQIIYRKKIILKELF